MPQSRSAVSQMPVFRIAVKPHRHNADNPFVSAERNPKKAESAEIIYLLIPPSARPLPAQESLWERFQVIVWNFRHAELWERAWNNTVTFFGAIVFTFFCCVGLYGLYYLKSIYGIDLFGKEHLEDFVPIPGFNRW